MSRRRYLFSRQVFHVHKRENPAKSLNLHKHFLCFEKNTICHAKTGGKQTGLKISLQSRTSNYVTPKIKHYQISDIKKLKKLKEG